METMAQVEVVAASPQPAGGKVRHEQDDEDDEDAVEQGEGEIMHQDGIRSNDTVEHEQNDEGEADEAEEAANARAAALQLRRRLDGQRSSKVAAALVVRSYAAIGSARQYVEQRGKNVNGAQCGKMAHTNRVRQLKRVLCIMSMVSVCVDVSNAI